MELDLKSERRIYEAGIRPSAEIGIALIDHLEQAEQAVQRVRELHWRRKDRVGFYADSGEPIFRNVCGYCNDDHADGGVVPYPCDTIIALDGDGRG